MPKRYELSNEQQEELEKLRKTNKNKNVEKRIKALLLHKSGKKSKQIAEETGYSKTYISQLVSRYCNYGKTVIMGGNYKCNHRNISYQEEENLLESFKELAEKGQIIEITEIKKAYEKIIGRSLDTNRGQIYCVLHRHDWRKVIPRSKHPNKASEEVIETSKKLTLESRN